MSNTFHKNAGILFIVFLCVAAIARMYGLHSFSLSNDELSAVFRLDYSTLTEMIKQGVIATDPHPAGVQVFLYYWTKLFGSSVLALRIPFVLASLLGLTFMTLTFKDWFGERTSLMVLALFSVLSFTIIQSQLARPYAIGFMFVMIFVWSWTQLLFNSKTEINYKILFVLSGALSCYTHYFAALMVGFISLSGVFVAYKKSKLKLYLFLGLLIILAFSPHVSITLSQLSRGSLTSWITPPESDFIWNHISTLLNQSSLLISIVLVFTLISLWNFFKSDREKKIYVMFSFLFFLFPIAVGYIYSISIGSVLMDRVLFFSAPFFFAIVFSNLPQVKDQTFIWISILICVLGLGSTIFETSFSERAYVENFEGLAADAVELRSDQSDDELILFGNFNSTKYISYYTDNQDIKFISENLDSDQKLAEAFSLIRSTEATEMGLFWACKYLPISILEYARLYFPTLALSKMYYNSGMWLFTKSNFERIALINKEMYRDTLLTPALEFLNIFNDVSQSLEVNQVLNVHIKYKAEEIENMMLVFALNDENGNSVIWRGHNLSDYAVNGNSENEYFGSFKMPDSMPKTYKVGVYIWNPNHESASIQSITLTSYADSNYPTLY